ncbi:unnamed protein product [Callosobruchus maculatus]|nr:unnamed protein product [Callosobruchus maculatus]
MIFRRST